MQYSDTICISNLQPEVRLCRSISVTKYLKTNINPPCKEIINRKYRSSLLSAEAFSEPCMKAHTIVKWASNSWYCESQRWWAVPFQPTVHSVLVLLESTREAQGKTCNAFHGQLAQQQLVWSMTFPNLAMQRGFDTWHCSNVWLSLSISCNGILRAIVVHEQCVLLWKFTPSEKPSFIVPWSRCRHALSGSLWLFLFLIPSCKFLFYFVWKEMITRTHFSPADEKHGMISLAFVWQQSFEFECA